MRVKTLIKTIILILVMAVIAFGVAVHKIDPAQLADNIKGYIHYYKMEHNSNYEKISIKGVPVFVARDLSDDQKDKVQYALKEATKTLSNDELKQLDMLVYTPSNQLPDYLQTDQNVNYDISNNMVEGFYISNIKEIYIFPDIVKEDNSFEQKDVMLYVTLHEIGHHIDLSIKNNNQDPKAEYRAATTAFKKINKLGIHLDEYSVDNILNNL